jgi:glycosyltransferase involved in cell wall biosynthesis
MIDIQKKERIPQTPPIINPVIDGVFRPLFSVAILVYNCYEYIKLSLQSVLQQDLGPDKMEIYVVDDGSTDGNVEELIKNIGGDRVVY